LLARLFYVFRVKETFAKVSVLDIFQSSIEVIQNGLIHMHNGSIGAHYEDIAADRVQHQAQIVLTRPQSLFSLLAIIDVRDKSIPVENLSFPVAHGNSAGLKPAVYTIEPTETILMI